MKVLKLCIGTWESASRDKRELSVVQELGAEVEVIAKGDAAHRETEVDGFRVTRLSARPLGEKVPVALNRAASIFTWAAYVRKQNDIDVISGHDLSGLVIGYLSNIGKRHKAKLVYDSHEFEIGRNARRSRLQIWAITHLERFLMKRCAFSIMVCDSIADEVQRIHRLKERPVVVRNIPPYWELDEAAIAQTRNALLSQLHLPDDTFLLMYHGHISVDLALENTLRAVAQLPNTAFVILGDVKESQLPRVHELCRELHITDRVLLHPLVPIEELRNYAGAADVSSVIGVPLYKSYYFALPNKLFENMQALTPVVVNNVPEKAKIIDRYGVGLKVDPENVDEIAAAIERMRSDRAFYNSCKENLKRAKEELCWEREKEILKKAYQTILWDER